uniref:Uncharacterized protein n=1 Tax=Avena sativa TaxID=4498 RepID=A0ACD5YV85_AVESA
MQVDKATGAKCFTLSASSLQISHFAGELVPVGSDFHCSKRGKRFLQAARLGYMNGLEIRAKVQRNMLSRNTTYVARLVFKLAPSFYGYDFPFQKASFGVAGSESTREICLQGYVVDDDNGDEPPRKYILPSCYPNRHATPPGEHVVFPRTKTDGWKEVELGEFHNEEGDDGEISISVIQPGHVSCGLIVWGIELRSSTKQQRPARL